MFGTLLFGIVVGLAPSSLIGALFLRTAIWLTNRYFAFESLETSSDDLLQSVAPVDPEAKPASANENSFASKTKIVKPDASHQSNPFASPAHLISPKDLTDAQKALPDYSDACGIFFLTSFVSVALSLISLTLLPINISLIFLIVILLIAPPLIYMLMLPTTLNKAAVIYGIQLFLQLAALGTVIAVLYWGALLLNFKQIPRLFFE